MLKLIHTEEPFADFLRLDRELEEYYVRRFGDVALQYRLYNTLDAVTDVFTIYDVAVPAGIGCIRPFAADGAELKRVYVREEYCRRGVARQVLRAAEEAARARGKTYMVLETGAESTEALALYGSAGYERSEPFGQFRGDPLCVCMRKAL